jgi:hypothetical protein
MVKVDKKCTSCGCVARGTTVAHIYCLKCGQQTLKPIDDWKDPSGKKIKIYMWVARWKFVVEGLTEENVNIFTLWSCYASLTPDCKNFMDINHFNTYFEDFDEAIEDMVDNTKEWGDNCDFIILEHPDILQTPFNSVAQQRALSCDYHLGRLWLRNGG